MLPLVALLTIIPCAAMIVTLSTTTHLLFLVWLILGVIVYFAYSMHHSALHKGPQGKAEEVSEPTAP
ncbi:putative amino acid permease YhdG [compost metagenome]